MAPPILEARNLTKSFPGVRALRGVSVSLFGVAPAVGGRLLVDGQPVVVGTARDALAAGLALVPEDRKRQGLILALDVQENLNLPSRRRDQRHGFVNNRKAADITRTMIESLDVHPRNPRQSARFLSGGNQQKIVLGKWLALQPRVLLLDEPTRGVDIGAKRQIYKLLEELAGRGLAILFASSDMEEILALSDRVLVMHEGRLAGAVDRDQLDEESIMHLATGGPATAD